MDCKFLTTIYATIQKEVNSVMPGDFLPGINKQNDYIERQMIITQIMSALLSSIKLLMKKLG